MSGHVRTLVSVVAKCNPAWTSIHFNLLSVWFWSDPDAIARCAHAPQVLPSAPLKLQQSETALRFLFLLRLPGFFIWNTTTTCQKSAVADIHGRYYSQPCLCQRRPRAGPAHPGRCCAAQPPARPPERGRDARQAGPLRRWTRTFTYSGQISVLATAQSILPQIEAYAEPSSIINDESKRDHMYTKHIPI